MCRVTVIVCLFQIIMMSVILNKLCKGLDPRESKPSKVSVKVSTSVIKSSTNNNQKVEQSSSSTITARQQRSPNPIKQDQLFEAKKLQHFRIEDAVLPNKSWSEFKSSEPNERINYYNERNDYLTTNPQIPSSFAGRIMNHNQVNYLKPTISTSYIISPLYTTTTQEPLQHKMVSRQTSSMILRDQARNAGITSLKHDGQSDSDFNCHRRSLGKMFKGARSLLTDGFSSFQQYATSGNLMLGSSLLAAAIPLGALVLPLGDSRKRRAGLFMDEQSGGSGGVSRFSLQSRVDSMMSWIERSIEHLPNIPRLHPQECVKRSICEAHNDPNKYGAIGFILRLLFPATNLSSTDRMDNMEYKVINKYRHAAGYGLNKRIDNNGTETPSVCKEKYEDCLVSLLDIGRNLMDLFLK